VDEFGGGVEPDTKSIEDYMGESGSTGVRLKGVRSSGDLPSDNLSSGLSGPSGQFALRYDFGQSLSRAKQGTKNDAPKRSDGLYMKPNKKAAPIAVNTGTENQTRQRPPVQLGSTSAPAAASPADSPAADLLSSATYEEIVNKWCFVGFPGPQLPSRPSTAQEQMGVRIQAQNPSV
jgi:hypothetical protein